jgi:hypothetical protein
LIIIVERLVGEIEPNGVEFFRLPKLFIERGDLCRFLDLTWRRLRVSKVCLIYEFNCYLGGDSGPVDLPRRGWLRSLFLPAPDPDARKPPAPAPPQCFGSIWAMVGTLRQEDDYTEVARKIAGPLPREQALAALSALRAELEAAGMQVIEETVADD